MAAPVPSFTGSSSAMSGSHAIAGQGDMYFSGGVDWKTVGVVAVVTLLFMLKRKKK